MSFVYHHSHPRYAGGPTPGEKRPRGVKSVSDKSHRYQVRKAEIDASCSECGEQEAVRLGLCDDCLEGL